MAQFAYQNPITRGYVGPFESINEAQVAWAKAVPELYMGGFIHEVLAIRDGVVIVHPRRITQFQRISR